MSTWLGLGVGLGLGLGSAHLAAQHVAQPQLLGGHGERVAHAVAQEDLVRVRVRARVRARVRIRLIGVGVRVRLHPHAAPRDPNPILAP